MPRLFRLLPLLLLPLLPARRGSAQTNQVSAKPPLTHVTVYLNGTTLEHRGELTLAAGLNRVVIDGLSPSYSEEKMEVILGEGAELLSVGGTDYNDVDEQPEPTPPSKALADSLTRVRAAVRRAEAELMGLQQEKTFLLANQALPAGTQANWSAEVQKGGALMRTRLPAIQLETERLNTRLAALKQAETQLLVPPAAGPVLTASQLDLSVKAARAGTVAVTLRYFVAGRGTWLPKLDIRADATGRELAFVTHGRLRNRTRLDWHQVQVVLMRHALEEEVLRPALTPWELNFRGDQDGGEGRVDAFVVKGTAKGQPADLLQSTRYEVPGRLSLTASGTGATRFLTLPAVKLAGQPEYLAVPRVSENVVLQAKVSGWQGLQLEEEAAVYRQGMYVGRTELNEEAYNDSLEVALGHDDQLLVGRAKLEDHSSNVGLSDKRRVYLSYELNVRNRHPETVRLRLLDEIPISEEEKISVKLLNASGAQLDARTGKLTWLLTLPPGASQKVQFSFQVDYPKNEKVEIINHRVRISNPKFR